MYIYTIYILYIYYIYFIYIYIYIYRVFPTGGMRSFPTSQKITLSEIYPLPIKFLVPLHHKNFYSTQ